MKDSELSHEASGDEPVGASDRGASARGAGADGGAAGSGAAGVLLNAFTCDVEDYFQVTAFEGVVNRADWPGWESRVVANTRRVLELLANHTVRGTFYVLGWVAERFPHLVREIQGAGHEIGSHGYWHRLIYTQTPDEFRKDLNHSRRALEDITGQPVTLYRAPSFSITRKSLWALDILAEEGIHIDSSVFPIYHDRCGIPDARPEIHLLKTEGAGLWEFPPSVVRLAGVNVPVSGGGYFRLYPTAWSEFCLRRINVRQGRPFMFYIHPWELDPEQPRLNGLSRVSWMSRFRHYVNLRKTSRKLERLLRGFRFGCVTEVVRATIERES